MKDRAFEITWVEVILQSVNSKRGRKATMTSIGGLNGRVFNPGRLAIASLHILLRLLVNLAMCLTRKEWGELWQKLGNIIYEMGENHGDEYNESNRRHRGNRQATTD